MKSILFATALCLAGTTATAWEFIKDSDDEGDMYIAEQIGEAGMMLEMFCADGMTSVNVYFPYPAEGEEMDMSIAVQVDDRAPMLLAGTIGEVDDQTSSFVGIDRTDRPALKTPELIAQAKAGNQLVLMHPDGEGIIERWPLAGFTAAMRSLEAGCK